MSKTEKINSEVESMELTTMNGKMESITIYDSKLIQHTKNIQALRETGNVTILAIANEFNQMDIDESYKTAGFKTVADFGRVVFDYKHSTVSLYLRSAKAFIKLENGKLKMNGCLPMLTIGQMIELLPLVKNETDISEVETAFKECIINQQMSTKKLRDAVNGIRGIAQRDTIEKTPLEKASKLKLGENGEIPKGKTKSQVASIYSHAIFEALEKMEKLATNSELEPTEKSMILDKIVKANELVSEVATALETSDNE